MTRLLLFPLVVTPLSLLSLQCLVAIGVLNVKTLKLSHRALKQVTFWPRIAVHGEWALVGART